MTLPDPAKRTLRTYEESQRQDSLTEQMQDVIEQAEMIGAYDAADWISRGSTQHKHLQETMMPEYGFPDPPGYIEREMVLFDMRQAGALYCCEAGVGAWPDPCPGHSKTTSDDNKRGAE